MEEVLVEEEAPGHRRRRPQLKPLSAPSRAEEEVLLEEVKVRRLQVKPLSAPTCHLNTARTDNPTSSSLNTARTDNRTSSSGVALQQWHQHELPKSDTRKRSSGDHIGF